MKSFLAIICFMLPCLNALAQFRSSGKIEFTRSVNLKLSMQLEADEEFKNSSYFKEMIKTLPTNYPSYFNMTYNKNQSSYYFIKDGEVKNANFWDSKVASENTVVLDYSKKMISAQKEIFEKDYWIYDSLPKYKWKIHDETRDIAGYTCRKATTIINDSVVVVAYYTDRIMVSGGPESFNGLPGMILGVVIPRLYTSWFATKVSDSEIPEEQVKKIKKSKSVTYETMFKEIKPKLTEWGSWGASFIWKATF